MELFLSFLVLLTPIILIAGIGLAIYTFVGLIKLYKKTKITNFDSTKSFAFFHRIEKVLGIKQSILFILLGISCVDLLIYYLKIDNEVINYFLMISNFIVLGIAGYQFATKIGLKNKWIAVIFPTLVGAYVGYSSKYTFNESNVEVVKNNNINNIDNNINNNIGMIDNSQNQYICKKCGNVLNSNLSFCNLCGEKIINEPKQNVSSFCSKCGNKFPDGANFCIYCGNKRS